MKMNYRIPSSILLTIICFFISCHILFSQNKQLDYEKMAKENIKLLFNYLTLGNHLKTQTLLSNDILISGYGKDKASKILKTISDRVALTKNYNYKAINKINDEIKVRLKMDGHKSDFTFTLNELGKFTEINIVKIKLRPISNDKKEKQITIPSNAIPFNLLNRYVIFKTKIKDHTLTFIFDSGVQGTVIDKEVAKKLNLPTNGKVTYRGISNTSRGTIITVAEFKLSNRIIIKNLLAGTADLSEISNSLGDKIDGIIGHDLLASFVTKIDFDAKIMSFANTMNRFNTENYKAFFFSLKNGTPEINTTIKLKTGTTIKGKIKLDSGLGSELLLNGKILKKNKIFSELEPQKEISGLDIGGNHKTYLSSIASLHFLSETFYDVPLRFTKNKLKSDNIGLIGNKIISKYDWIFDYKNNKAYYKQNKYYQKPFKYLCTPFVIIKRKNKLLFKDVNKTYDDEIKNNYEIISVNNLKSNDFKKVRELILTESIKLTIVYLDNNGNKKTFIYHTKRMI